MSIEEYRDQIVDYLVRERDLYQQDIELNKNLSEEQKVNEGLLILDAVVVKCLGEEYVLQVKDNFTKLRPGDSVVLYHVELRRKIGATIIENASEEILLRCSQSLKEGEVFNIEVQEFVLLDSLIALMKSLEAGTPGAGLLAIMADNRKPRPKGMFGSIDINKENVIPSSLNVNQRKAIANILLRPTLYCLQGPPGTGKTFVLGLLAYAFSKHGLEVMILSKTHQAVNNALNAINKVDKESCIVKIGDDLKAMDLDSHIIQATTYGKYIFLRKELKREAKGWGDIVGMTMQAAVVNLGLKNQGFKPQVVLIDEASQIPVTEAAWLGASGAGTIVFIGDEHQMPPIFHQGQQYEPLSESIFSFLHRKFPDYFNSLDITFRMNDEITDVVSRKFYEPSGIRLISHESASNRRLSLNVSCDDKRIERILSQPKSIFIENVSKETIWEDENNEEALFAAQLLAESLRAGLSVDDVAIITPFRRQVRAIREQCAQLIKGELPLIDTVERLQGQDVQMIIISMCVSNSQYYFTKQRSFLLNPNRLNVMISRAKTKVVFLASEVVELKSQIDVDEIPARITPTMKITDETLQEDVNEVRISNEIMALKKILTESCNRRADNLENFQPILHVTIQNQFNGPVGSVINNE